MTASHMFDNATTPALKTHSRSQEAIRSNNHCTVCNIWCAHSFFGPVAYRCKAFRLLRCRGCAFRITVRNEESLRTIAIDNCTSLSSMPGRKTDELLKAYSTFTRDYLILESKAWQYPTLV